MCVLGEVPLCQTLCICLAKEISKREEPRRHRVLVLGDNAFLESVGMC